MASRTERGFVLTAGAPARNNVITAAQGVVAAGWQMAIMHVRLELEGVAGQFFLQAGGVDVMAIQSLVPGFIDRNYKTPIIVDGLAGATSFAVQLAAANGNNCYAFVAGELSQNRNTTVNRYARLAATTGGGAVDNIGAAYTVPVGRVLWITDIDFSASAACLFGLNRAAARCYDADLVGGGAIWDTLQWGPIVCTAGQVVQMVAVDAGGGATVVDGGWTGQLF